MYYELSYRVSIRKGEDNLSKGNWVARIIVTDHRVPETTGELKDTSGLAVEREFFLTDPDKNRLIDRTFSTLELVTKKR